VELGTDLPLLQRSCCWHAQMPSPSRICGHARSGICRVQQNAVRTRSIVCPLCNVEGHQQAFNFHIQTRREAILQVSENYSFPILTNAYPKPIRKLRNCQVWLRTRAG